MALEIRDLRFRYPSYGAGSADPVLDGLEFSLEAGRMGAVFADADAGKSTLARIIAGLVPRFTGGEISGRIEFRGRDLTACRPYELTDAVGTVFQNADEQILTTRCDTEVSFALESLGMERSAMEVKVGEALDLMGLSSMASRNPATLSGGEKKRLLLACAAAIDPELWILDEVFEELDRTWKLRLLRFLNQRGRTVLFLDSRWSPLYAESCSRFAVISGGRISVSADTPDSPELTAELARQGAVLPASLRLPALPPVTQECALQAEGISFRFAEGEPFEISIDALELKKGRICSLLGDNGSGKSTLGKLLCGLLVPGSGSLMMQTGSARRRVGPEELHRRVGYMFQNPDYQIFLPTVREELELGLSGRAGRKAAVEEAMERFGLPDGGMPPALMSYGARKKLQAATYYLLKKDFLILDEIDSGLSYRGYLPLLEALASLGAGILLITHDRELARAVSDRILVMDGGRIVRDIPRADLDQMTGRMDSDGDPHGA